MESRGSTVKSSNGAEVPIVLCEGVRGARLSRIVDC